MFIRSVLFSADAEGAGGGGAPVSEAPATEAKPSTAPELPKKPVSKEAAKREAVKRSAGELKAHLAAQRAAKDAERTQPEKPAAEAPKASAKPAASEPTAKAEKLADAIEDEGGKAPEQREGESDKKYELRLAKALQDLRAAEQATKKERSEREAAQKKVSEVEKREADLLKKIQRAKDPETALEMIEELTGFDYEALTRGIVEGKVKPKGAKLPVPDEIRQQIEAQAAELAELKKVEQERAKEREQAQQKQRFESHVAQAKTWLEENADDFPALAAIEWSAQDLVRQAYASNTGDLPKLARQLEENFATNLLGAVKSERAIKSLLKRDPELKEKLIAALGVQQAPARVPTEKVSAPRSLSKLPTEVPAPADPRKLSKREQATAAAAALAAWKRQQRERASR